jgi:hypothetical protein
MKRNSSTLPCRFGFSPEGDQHHFCVNIPKQYGDEVTIQERFLVLNAEKPLTKDRRAQTIAALSNATWQQISSHFVRDIKHRVSKMSKSSVLQTGENWLPRLIGKELCVLAWAVESASPTQIQSALQRWSNLTPEERWWLFNMASADLGAGAKGWKLALQVALCEKDMHSFIHQADDASSSAVLSKTSQMTRGQAI